MARQTVNIGTSPNDGTGDALRVAFDKLNDNFLEIYEDGGANIIVNNPITSTETTLDTALLDLNTGGGGSQTLQEVSDTGGLSNGATLKQGTTDAGLGGVKGIALKCSVDYELKWEAGRLYVMEQDGFTIREVSHNFTVVPAITDDITKGFVVGSRWLLDNGTLYTCSDATTGAAVWDITVSGTPTLQDVLNEGSVASIVTSNTDTYSVSMPFDDGIDIYAEDRITDSSNDNFVYRQIVLNRIQNGVANVVGSDTYVNENYLEAMSQIEGDANRTNYLYTNVGGVASQTYINIPTPKIGANVGISFPYKEVTGDYTLATIDDIPTNTSDLINDGDDGNPFISLLDLPSNIIFYPTNVSSDIGGYFKIVTSITDPSYNTTAVDISTGAITTTNQLISSLATTPNILVGNPGVFNITTIGNIRRISGSGEASFYFKVYKRTSAGVETLVATSDNTIPVLDGGTYIEFSATGIWNDGIFLDTDRVVMKYYANRIAGGSNPTYEFQFGGVTPVRTLVPIPLSVVPTIPNATETVAGIAEIATTAEVTTGTDDTRIITPLKLKQVTNNYMQVILNCNVLGSTLSGGTNVVLYQVDVPANTFSDLDAFEIEALGAKVGVTATSTIRLWTDTVSTFNSGTAQLLAVSAALGATNLFQTIKREFHVRGTTVKCLANTVGVPTDEATGALSANPWASYTFNPAVANTLYLTVTGNAADTFTKQNYKITRYKNKSTI